MGVFDIDYSGSGLVKSLLPVRRRKSRMLAWLQALVGPVGYLYGLFTANRANNLYWLSHSGQVCYIEAALNDVFDPDGRSIYITDPAYADPVYIYRRIEEKPVYVSKRSESGSTDYESPQWLYRRSETYAFGYQFIVNVPSDGEWEEHHLRAIVDKYRLPGKGYYNIVTV